MSLLPSHWRKLGHHVEAQLRPDGHWLGACEVWLRRAGQTLAFSGDLWAATPTC